MLDLEKRGPRLIMEKNSWINFKLLANHIWIRILFSSSKFVHAKALVFFSDEQFPFLSIVCSSTEQTPQTVGKENCSHPSTWLDWELDFFRSWNCRNCLSACECMEKWRKSFHILLPAFIIFKRWVAKGKAEVAKIVEQKCHVEMSALHGSK